MTAQIINLADYRKAKEAEQVRKVETRESADLSWRRATRS
jgi:hypothetical protein